MIDRGFIDVPSNLTSQWFVALLNVMLLLYIRWWNKSLAELDLTVPLNLKPDTPCYEVVKLLKDENYSCIAVIGKDGSVIMYFSYFGKWLYILQSLSF